MDPEEIAEIRQRIDDVMGDAPEHLKEVAFLGALAALKNQGMSHEEITARNQSELFEGIEHEIGAKPDWVESWTWTAYLQFVSATLVQFKWHQDIGKRKIDAFGVGKKIVMDKECKKIWDYIHRDLATHNYGVVHADSYSRDRRIRYACDIFVSAQQGTAPPRPADLIPARERKRKGLNIALLARKLMSEIEPLEKLGWMEINEFYSPFSKLSEMLGGACFEKVKEECFQHISEDELFQRSNLVMDATSNVIDNLTSVLTQLGDSASAWSETKPVLYRPKAKDADRTFFVRKMTEMFREAVGSPMREYTAILAKCIYGRDIDAAMVTKLAP